MPASIPTFEDLEKLISRITKETLEDVLPKVIREATRKEWLTTEEVTEILQCSIRHVQYLRDSKQLTYSKNGRLIRYHIDDVDALLNASKVERVEN